VAARVVAATRAILAAAADGIASPMITSISRGLAWLLLAAILFFSLVPPMLRPVTGAPHELEHFTIFALCGLALGLGYRVAHLFQAFALVTFSGVLEMLQLLVPGRHARINDFAVDAVASCAGVVLAWAVPRFNTNAVEIDDRRGGAASPDLRASAWRRLLRRPSGSSQ
jgi:VanZ family protein